MPRGAATDDPRTDAARVGPTRLAGQAERPARAVGAEEASRRAAQAAAARLDSGAGADGEDPPERGPMRRCIVTRESRPKAELLRFVLGPDRALVPDLAGRLPGRGMWLSADADVLERGVKKGAFARAARGAIHPPPDLRDRIEDGLRARLRDLLGFARRGGLATCGRETVREWLRAGRVGLLVEASDGSAAERAKLVGGWDGPVVMALPAATLGGVFGRDHAVHIAVAPGKMAAAIAVEAARLAGFAGRTNNFAGGGGRRPDARDGSG